MSENTEYLTDFQDCIITQSDINALICELKMDAAAYRKIGQPTTATALDAVQVHVSLLVSKLQGRHAANKIVELCGDRNE